MIHRKEGHRCGTCLECGQACSEESGARAIEAEIEEYGMSIEDKCRDTAHLLEHLSSHGKERTIQHTLFAVVTEVFD